jgi:hypothetical protein
MRATWDAEESDMVPRDLAWPRALELVSLDLGAPLMHLYGLDPETAARTRGIARRCLSDHWHTLHGTWTNGTADGDRTAKEVALLDAFDLLQPLGSQVIEQIRDVAITFTNPPSRFTNEENWNMLLWNLVREDGLRALPLDREHVGQLAVGLDAIVPSEADYAVLRRIEAQEEDPPQLTAWDRRVMRRLVNSNTNTRNVSDMYSYSTRLVSTKRAVEYLNEAMSANDMEQLLAWAHEKQRTRPMRYGTLPLAPLGLW